MISSVLLPSQQTSGHQASKVITARSRSNFSSSFLFLPYEKRKAMQRVYAFFRTVDDLVDEEPDLERQKQGLASWREALIQTYQGNPPFPLMEELKESIERFQIPQEYFLQLLEGCEMDLTKKRYEHFEELHAYCYRVASMVGLVCMQIFGYQTPTSKQAAVDLGLALQLTNIIRDVGIDLEKDRIYLPLEDLKRFGVSQEEIIQRRPTEPFFQLMEFQYQRALGYYQRGFEEFQKDKKGKLLAARIMGTVYRRILEKIRKQHYPVLTKRVRLSYFEKLWILFKIFLNFQ